MAAAIISACRTPIGKFQGALSTLPATDLGAAVIREAVKRAELSSLDVDEVIMGMVLPAGTGQAPARQAGLKAGLPDTAAAVTVNQVCGSGLKAVMLAHQSIVMNNSQVVVAGGMECMSRSPWLVDRQLKGVGNQVLIDSLMEDGLRCATSHRSMGEIAESLAARAGITRVQQDAYSAESHRRAILAQDQGSFLQELIAVDVPNKSGSISTTTDEGPRRDCTVSTLEKLRPAFVSQGTVTAGNAPAISDGAAAVVVTSLGIASERHLKPIAEIVDSATAGTAPEDLFTAPVDAIHKLLKRTKKTVADIDLWEINEAFAVQMLACQRQLDINPSQLNIHGGAIALGHPIGASGARVLTTLLHALRKHDREWGVAALCLGGGNAVAMLVRRI